MQARVLRADFSDEDGHEPDLCRTRKNELKHERIGMHPGWLSAYVNA